MTLLLDFGRELGLALRGVSQGTHFGWTTDKAKAETMRGNGARVQYVPSMDQRAEARKFDGWEVSFGVGAEVVALADGEF